MPHKRSRDEIHNEVNGKDEINEINDETKDEVTSTTSFLLKKQKISAPTPQSSPVNSPHPPVTFLTLSNQNKPAKKPPFYSPPLASSTKLNVNQTGQIEFPMPPNLSNKNAGDSSPFIFKNLMKNLPRITPQAEPKFDPQGDSHSNHVGDNTSDSSDEFNYPSDEENASLSSEGEAEDLELIVESDLSDTEEAEENESSKLENTYRRGYK